MSYTLFQKREEEIVLDPGLLDAGERERYKRWIDPARQLEFLAGRCFLKEVLGAALGIAPQAVSLSLSANGRPYLPAVYGPGAPHFSLAHAAGRYLVGLSSYPIGVDLEPARPRPVQSLRPFLSSEEYECLLALPAADQHLQLLRLFTLKEALIKASDRRWGLDEIAFSLENKGWKLEKPAGNFTFHHWEESGFFGAVCLFMPLVADPSVSVKVGLKSF